MIDRPLVSKLFLSLFVFTLTFFAGLEQSAHAWGCEGHEAVALIAMKQLEANNPEALKKAVAVLEKSPILPSTHRFCTPSGLPIFADVSTWADDVRNSSTASFHFIDVPLSVSPPINTITYCTDGCVFDALLKFEEQFKKPTATDQDRANALRYLIHFVGDSHQPLHDSMNGDRGGNCVPVKYLTHNPSIKPDPKDPTKIDVSINLHGVWDKLIIQSVLKNHMWTVDQYATKLQMKYQASATSWAKNPPLVWITQGHNLAETAYSKLGVDVVEHAVNVDKCTIDLVQPLFDRHFAIDQTYVNSQAIVIEKQIARAGFRLAALVEEMMK